MDLDVFKGSCEELLAWAGLAAATKPAGPVQPEVVAPQPQPTGGGTVSETSTPATVEYVVKSLDALSGIALQFHTDMDAILAVNLQIKNPNVISADSTIRIPRV